MITYSENVIFSTSDIPPYSYFANESVPDCVQRLFEIFHQTASDDSYHSRGEGRQEEEHCIFHYTLSGMGEVIYGGVSYPVCAGQGFFNVINAKNCGYGYPQNAKDPWEFIVLCFKGAGVRETVAAFCERKTVFEVDVQELSAICHDAIGREQGRIGAFSRLISLVCDESRDTCSIVNDFRHYVCRHCEKNPTVLSVARYIGVTREHLSRVYFEKTGETPAAFIKQKRFEMLCDFIALGMPFGKIALEMRFPSVQGMSLFFKKMSGISPSEYKKKGYLKI